MKSETLFTCGRFSLELTEKGIEAKQYFDTVKIFKTDELAEALQFVYKQRGNAVAKIEGLKNLSRRKFTEAMKLHNIKPETLWRIKTG